MPKIHLTTAAMIALSWLPPVAAAAHDSTSTHNWKEQETWIQFTEKESHGGFKMSRHTSPAAPSAEQPGTPPVWLPAGGNPACESSATAGNFNIPSWIVVDQKGADSPTYGSNKVETEMVPLAGYHARPVWGDLYYGSWGHHPYWGVGTYGAPPFSHGTLWTSPLGAVPFGSSRPCWGMRTKVIQTGPSKPSGNYYSPSTADPTASGSYYASSGPRALPVMPAQPPPAKDYWGEGGSPLPEGFQSR